MPSRLAGVLLVALSSMLLAGELQDRTGKAYDAYYDAARRTFVARALANHDTPPRPGVVTASPGGKDGIVEVPGGLVHHWAGATFMPGATLQQALTVSHGFDAYPKVYKTVLAARLESRDGETYHVWMRLKAGGGGVSAVLDVRSTIAYVRPTPSSTYAVSNLDDIREVKNAGARDESLLPPGRDSGYLWRGNSFTFFSERDGGLYVEAETIGLSRRFPPVLGWFIEPIARRIGRQSVETSLQEFAAAIGRMR
jgi:hypothetical protein